MTAPPDPTMLMIAPGAVRVDSDAGRADLHWPGDGRRVSLGAATMRIVAQFAVPDSAAAVVQRIGGGAEGAGDTVRRAIGRRERPQRLRGHRRSV